MWNEVKPFEIFCFTNGMCEGAPQKVKLWKQCGSANMMLCIALFGMRSNLEGIHFPKY